MNKGEAPPHPATAVGQFRVLIGDVDYTPLDPVQVGFGDYAMFSDDEIEVFLMQADNSLEGSLYWAYMQMAGAAARESKNVKDLDLQVDLTKRATDLRLMAIQWKEAWDQVSADIFEVFDIGGLDCGCVPELAPRTVCRRGCNGSGLF